jgi:hypothetical protein
VADVPSGLSLTPHHETKKKSVDETSSINNLRLSHPVKHSRDAIPSYGVTVTPRLELPNFAQDIKGWSSSVSSSILIAVSYSFLQSLR